MSQARTVADIGGVRHSGTRCSTCNTTYAACTRRLMGSGGAACCDDCFETDTHDERTIPSRTRDTTTRERKVTMTESTTIPEVGTDLYPLSEGIFGTVPRGTVLTLRSKPVGQADATHIVFGCQTFSHGALIAANAHIQYDGTRSVVTADAVVNGSDDEILIADRHIGIYEINDYCESITIKQIGDPSNALVMEYGFYGCATHAGEVIFLGLGTYGDEAPIMCRVYPSVRRTSNALTGTIGNREGLRHTEMTGCIPVHSATSAQAMNLSRQRMYAAVPATSEQVAAVGALRTRRQPLRSVHIEHDLITPCTNHGIPL